MALPRHGFAVIWVLFRFFFNNKTHPWNVDKKLREQAMCMQQGSLVLCEKQSYTVAEVHCVGVSSVHHSSAQAAGGFAVLSPLPEVMWSPESLFKLSLRRITLPSTEVLTAALKKEHSKFPSRLEMLRNNVGKSVKLDAGRKLPECTLEVCSLCLYVSMSLSLFAFCRKNMLFYQPKITSSPKGMRLAAHRSGVGGGAKATPAE